MPRVERCTQRQFKRVVDMTQRGQPFGVELGLARRGCLDLFSTLFLLLALSGEQRSRLARLDGE